ncbi:MAG TPA: serine hydrolase domain-containing protein [Thermomicrobiales bacterium]|nr:serine hydrolase domain-containing protein [Thermomicrobiales bacterium]
MTGTLAAGGDLAATVREELARWTVPGAAVGVLRDGEVETAGYGVASLRTGQPATGDTLFRVGSISKLFTATLVMTAVDEGKLGLDTPIAAYLPDLRLADEAARRAITPRHLLSHQSGLYGDFFEDHGWGEDALARAIGRFHTLRQVTAPGELWTYCNAGFHLLGAAVARVLGTTFEAAMRERVFAPLGLAHTTYYLHEAVVHPFAVGHNQTEPGGDEHEVAPQYYPRNRNPAGGVISTAGDLLAFAAFHLGDGMANGARVLREATLRAMREPQVRAGNFAHWYGLGWAIETIGDTTVIGHGGTTSGFQAHLTLVPARRFALAILTNSARGSAAIRGIERRALARFCDLERAEPATVALAPAALARLAGRYAQPQTEITVTVADGDLRLAAVAKRSPLRDADTPLPPQRLRPIGEHQFVVVGGEGDGARVDFIPGPDGRPRFIRAGGRLAERVVE